MNTEQARFNMIEQQVRPWNVLDPFVLGLLDQISRDDFVQPGQRSMAFMDLELPLPCGQVMLTPRVQARLVQDALPQPTDKVLQIGAGSGFMTALLAGSAQSVVAYDIHPELAQFARDNLHRAGIHADVRDGCGFKGAQATGPFDVIVLCGSVAEVPHELLSQLKIGGRLIAITGHEPAMQAIRITRDSEDSYTTEELWDVVVQRLEGVPEPTSFRF